MMTARRALGPHVLVALALVPLALMRVSPARAANELCGQTITESVTLTADQACTGGGLVVDADGVTVDLAGFTISGDGGGGDFGVFIQDNRTKTTIKNGTIRHFAEGVRGLVGSLKLSRLTVRDSTGDGVDLGTQQFSIDRCLFIGNASRGMLILTSGPTKGGKITASAFLDNGSHGFQVEVSPKATITNIITAGNGGWGMLLSQRGTSVRSSVIARNAAGGVLLEVASGKVKVTQNRIIGNGGDGVKFNFSSGDAGRNVVDANLIAGNLGNGVNVDQGSDGNAVVNNGIFGNGDAGVTVVAGSDNTLVKGNIAVGNGGNAFESANASTTFAKNTGNGNLGLVVSAAAAIDGGGNRGRGNAPFEVCSPGIACAPQFTPKAGTTMPTCDMHVASSITLGADMPNCVGIGGMTVDADDITINLNGHVLRGNRSAGPIGIEVGNHRGVTIANGAIRGFDVGINLGDLGERLKIVNVEVRDSLNDGGRFHGHSVRIDKSVFVQNTGNGVLFGQFASPVVTSSFFVHNGASGVRTGASTSLFAKNTSTLNIGHGADLGTIFGGEVTFQQGIVAGNLQSGIHVGGDFAATVANNGVFGNVGSGIVVEASGHAIVVDANAVEGNLTNGIELTASASPTTVTRNVVVGNAFYGVVLSALPQNATIAKNDAVGNGFTGIQSLTASATLTKNSASGNHEIGINSAPGAVDGGGNKAQFNAGAVQCTPTIACN